MVPRDGQFLHARRLHPPAAADRHRRRSHSHHPGPAPDLSAEARMIVGDRANAWLAFSGTICDAVGGLYLTYDLLGGRKGPLGFLTRAATYSLVVGLAYG